MALDVIDKLSRRVPAGPLTANERAEDELDWMKHQSAAMQPPPGAKSAAPDAMVQARNMLRSWITTANALQARTVFVALRAMALAYMMSPRQVLFSKPGADGRRVGAWHPHLMFYVPGATPAMFALEGENGEPIGLSNSGTPQAEVIVKVPQWADGTPVAMKAKTP